MVSRGGVPGEQASAEWSGAGGGVDAMVERNGHGKTGISRNDNSIHASF